VVPVLAVAFILVPIAELAVIVTAGRSIGFLPTFVLLVGLSLTGAWLARREGLSAWRRLQLALAEGRMPTVEVADGAMILLAGALLLTPGFLTDVVGVLLLLPPVRAAVRRAGPRLVAWRLRRMGGQGRPRTRVRVRRFETVDGVSYRPGSRPPGRPDPGPTGTDASWGKLELDDGTPPPGPSA
jgi:UPF0716 protein FxsA